MRFVLNDCYLLPLYDIFSETNLVPSLRPKLPASFRTFRETDLYFFHGEFYLVRLSCSYIPRLMFRKPRLPQNAKSA